MNRQIKPDAFLQVRRTFSNPKQTTTQSSILGSVEDGDEPLYTLANAAKILSQKPEYKGTIVPIAPWNNHNQIMALMLLESKDPAEREHGFVYFEHHINRLRNPAESF